MRLAESKCQLALFKWGLIPSWAKDAKIAYSTINARADTVATKPAFRSAFKKRRCLVLADGYVEWQKGGKAKLPWLYEVDGGKHRTGRQAHGQTGSTGTARGNRQAGRRGAFAGLWEWWGGPDGKARDTKLDRRQYVGSSLECLFHSAPSPLPPPLNAKTFWSLLANA